MTAATAIKELCDCDLLTDRSVHAQEWTVLASVMACSC